MKRLSLVLAITTLPLWAAWQNPTPICTATGTQENFLALPYADGGVLVLWEDSRSGNVDIYAQALDADGNALWQKDGIDVVSQPGNQTQFDAVVLESGDMVVAWNDERVSGQHSVYAQRVAPSGSLKWGVDGVPVRVFEKDPTFPELCSSNDGGIVLWSKGGSYAQSIRARRILKNGEMSWPDTGMYVCGVDVTLGNIVPDLKGGSIASYIQTHGGPGYLFSEFRVQRLDTLGNLLWGDSGVLLYEWNREAFQSSNGEFNTWCVADGFSGAIVIYRAEQWLAQRVSSNGSLLWSDSGVVVAPVDYGKPGSNSLLSNGGIYIIRGSPDAKPDEYVYVHRLTLEGETPFGDSGIQIWRVQAYWPTVDVYPHVTEDGIIVWGDVYDEGDSEGNRYEQRGILAQRVDTTSNILWSQEVLVCGVSGSSPSVVASKDKGGIIAWQDNRKGDLDLYATRIDSLGNLPPGVEEKPPSAEMPFSMEEGINRLSYDVPSGTQLSMYSCTGRLVNEQTISGKGVYIPNGYPSGIYFICLRNEKVNCKKTLTNKLVLVK